MKRIIALISALILILSFSACGKEKFDPETYVGEGLLSAFGALVDSNQHFYNEVFVLSHLKVDEKAKFEKDGKTYAPVTDEKYKTYDELVTALKQTYTDECVSKILKHHPIYADVDGKLCLDVKKAERMLKDVKWERNTDKAPKLKHKTETEYELEYYFQYEKKSEKEDFEFVQVGNGIRNSYRLDELQAVD